MQVTELHWTSVQIMAISNRPLTVGDINTWSLDGQVNIFTDQPKLADT